MTQYEQENLGGPGHAGEVDEETHAKAWDDAAARRANRNAADEEQKPSPKTSSGDT